MPEPGRSSAELPVGTMLADRYRIDAVLGEGGMGKVYAAEHVLMRKRLAIKVLHRELSNVPELVARFEREAMAAANIDHPNVAAATDFGKLPDGSVFLALELVEGRCLRDVMDTGPLAIPRALHVARQIAAALGSAHAQGIVHRDLKPENVMLVEKGGDPDFVKVLDFGVARVPIGDAGGPNSKAITRAGMVFGTPEYIPPEQALGQTSDGRADLYSLGVVLFEMIAGVRPFVGETKVSLVGQHVGKAAPPLSERAPGLLIPGEVEALVARLLEKETAKRVQTSGEVVAAIDVLIGKSKHAPFRTPIVKSPLAGLPDSSRIPTAPPAVPARGERPPGAGRSWSTLADRGAYFVERTRRFWPRPVRRYLDRLPPLAIAFAALVLVAAVPLVLFLAFATREAPRGAAAPTASAPLAPSAAPVSSASGQTPAASAAPAAPSAAELEQARRDAEMKEYPAAVLAVERALAIDPEARNDDRAASALFQAAQAAPSADAAFRLLEGPMKERGAAVVHDLAVYATKGSLAQKRAEAWLDSGAFSDIAPAPLRLAVAMRRAKSCREVRTLLGRVRENGDKHSLPYLEFFRQKLNAYPCLRSDSLLEETTRAVETRASQ